MPYSTLHGTPAKIFEEVYNKALKQYNNDKEKAARTAWAALKGAGYHKNDSGEWVKGKSEFAEFSMFISGASFDKSNQIMRWRAIASDTNPDLYEESMSLELFQDFTNRINNNIPVPEAFESIACENDWCGGMPYLSIAHYKSGDGKANVPGEPETVYVDGNKLKSKGFLHNTPIGKAVFDSLNRDLYAMKSNGEPEVPLEQRVRISIGFLDLQHKHIQEMGQEFTFARSAPGQICPLCEQGVGGKIYQKGQLVHLALTRVPVNPRTAMEVEKSMTGEIITKKDDAKSIIGDLAEELDGGIESKSQAGTANGLVIKNDITSDPERYTDECDKCYDPNTDSFDQECIDSVMAGNGALEFVHPALPKDSDLKREGALSPKSESVNKAMTKSESWGDEPSSSYLIVEDPKHPTTWHLPVKKHGKVDTGLMGAAKAALTSNHRGKAYGGPGKAKALAKLKSMYRSHGMDWESKSDVVEESMELGGTKVDEKKFEYAGVEGDPNRQEDKKVNPKAKTSKADEDDTKDTAADEEKEGEMPMKPMKKSTALETSVIAMLSKVNELQAQGVTGDEALKAIQEEFNAVGNEVKKSLTGEEKADMSNLSEVIKSAVADAVAPLAQELAIIKSQISNGALTKKSDAPKSRAITRPSDLLMKKSAPKQPNPSLDGVPASFRKLARASVYRGMGVQVPEEE